MKSKYVRLMHSVIILLYITLMYSPNINAAVIKDNSFKKGWKIFPAGEVTAAGSVISKPGYQSKKSYTTDIPKTVFAALTENGVYKNPYWGDNLAKISTKPFEQPWWYRKEFTIRGKDTDSNYLLTLRGINYKADLWLNGVKVSGGDYIQGPYGIFSFDVTKYIVNGVNAIAIEIYPPSKGDLTLGFVDWNPAPPDNNMGLWRGVTLRKTGMASLRDVFVKTKLDKTTFNEAELTISGVLTNYSSKSIKADVRGSFGKNNDFAKTFLVQPKSKLNFEINSNDCPVLKISHPNIWWPNNLGEHYLYNLNLKATIKNRISDEKNVRFGIREIESYVNEKGYRGYKINGKNILIKGAGWVDDMMLNDSDEKVKDEIRYAKQMNLNAIRLEGFWGKDKTLYDAADENGILIMVGWSCQWDWKDYCGREDSKYSCVTTADDIERQSRAFNQQVIWLRNHPSIMVWMLGSDKYPNPDLMKKMNNLLDQSDPTRPRLISAAGIKLNKEEKLSGLYKEPGVKMLGPYDYEPPVYWYADTSYGGAYGFNTETGPGPQVPPLESLKRMMPENDLWPIDSIWNYHCGRHEFATLNRYLKAFDSRYGKASSLEEFAMKSQMSNYEAMRPMFEAFEVNKFNSTGVIQWMFNSAWPEMYWQLFDYYLMPNGAFYGAMKGCQPINLVYNYKDKNIYLVNDYYKKFDKLIVSVKILDQDSKIIYDKNVNVSIDENCSRKIIDLPSKVNYSGLYFVDLELKDSANNLVSNNFYWLSSKNDSLDFDNSTWFYTPEKSFSDFKDIDSLPKTSISYSEKLKRNHGKRTMEVTLVNNSDKLAFFIGLKIVNPQTGMSVLPIYWTDNYVSVLPHSKRIIRGTFKDITPGVKPKLVISGWNINKLIEEKK